MPLLDRIELNPRVCNGRPVIENSGRAVGYYFLHPILVLMRKHVKK